MSKLLSVCIPTYNRKQSLQKLLSQIEKIEFEIQKYLEFIIVDNFSCYNIDDLTKQYNILNLAVYKNKENIGAINNLVKSYSLSTSDFVVAMGDDDQINISDLAAIINYLKKINNKWIFVGTIQNNKKIFLNRFKKEKLSFKDIYIDVLKNGIFSYGFIGSHIIPGGFLKNIIAKNRKYNDWFHLQLFLIYLFQKKNFNYFDKSLIIFSPYETDAHLFWTKKSNFFINISKFIAFSEVCKISKSCILNILQHIFFLKESISSFNLKNFFSWYLYDYNSFKNSNKEIIEFLNKTNLNYCHIYFYFHKLLNIKIINIFVNILRKTLYKKIIDYRKRKVLSFLKKTEGFLRKI